MSDRIMNTLRADIGLGRALVRCGDENHPTFMHHGGSGWHMLLSQWGLVRIVGQDVWRGDDVGTIWARTPAGYALACWLRLEAGETP